MRSGAVYWQLAEILKIRRRHQEDKKQQLCLRKTKIENGGRNTSPSTISAICIMLKLLILCDFAVDHFNNICYKLQTYI